MEGKEQCDLFCNYDCLSEVSRGMAALLFLSSKALEVELVVVLCAFKWQKWPFLSDKCCLCISVCIYSLCVCNGTMYCTCVCVCSMFTYVHCRVLLVFQGLTPACVSWHLCVCFMCILKGTRSMTPAAIHYLRCLVYNIFALSRGPACNWHINQQINTGTLRSLDGLHSASPSGSDYLLYTHISVSLRHIHILQAKQTRSKLKYDSLMRQGVEWLKCDFWLLFVYLLIHPVAIFDSNYTHRKVA